MPRPAKIPAGTRFGLWSAIREVAPHYSSGGHKRRAFLCRCECGTEKEMALPVLRAGLSRSCGCKTGEWLRESATKHGVFHHPLYKVWQDMVRRCQDPKRKGYHNYGGRGISVCREWQGSEGVGAFVRWSEANGYRKGLEIDRKDNDGNYTPDNCRWISKLDNLNNLRKTVWVEYEGQIMSLRQCWRKHGEGIAYITAWTRYRHGVPIERAMKAEKCKFPDRASSL